MSYSIHIRLKEILDSRNITQKELAKMANIRESTISDICRGTRTVICFSIKRLIPICFNGSLNFDGVCHS